MDERPSRLTQTKAGKSWKQKKQSSITRRLSGKWIRNYGNSETRTYGNMDYGNAGLFGHDLFLVFCLRYSCLRRWMKANAQLCSAPFARTPKRNRTFHVVIATRPAYIGVGRDPIMRTQHSIAKYEVELLSWTCHSCCRTLCPNVRSWKVYSNDIVL